MGREEVDEEGCLSGEWYRRFLCRELCGGIRSVLTCPAGKSRSGQEGLSQLVNIHPIGAPPYTVVEAVVIDFYAVRPHPTPRDADGKSEIARGERNGTHLNARNTGRNAVIGELLEPE